MNKIRKIAVFCGSSKGFDNIFRSQSRLLGRTLAENGIEVIYGGASVGLMGEVADGALESGGKVTGVFPDFLMEREIAHERLTEMIIVESMHARKLRMNDMSDAVIALPGGFGTLEEMFEMLTWGQLGLHTKPVALLNTAGFYDDMIKLINNMVGRGFLKEHNRRLLLIDNDVDRIIKRIKEYTAPEIEKWISKDEV